MSVDKFTFISPGVFISEIDESQNPIAPDVMGPVIIGRTTKGPAMRPVKVKSYNEYVSIFGDPHPGGLIGGDAWRSEVNHTGPTYAGYATKAWLNAGTAPATIIRLLGEDNDSATSTTTGWTTYKTTNNVEMNTNGGAYGLFVIDSGSCTTHNTGTLAAVFYIDSGSALVLSGTMRTGSSAPNATASAGCLIKSTADNNHFDLSLYHLGSLIWNQNINFDVNDGNYIRNKLNTNASLTNTDIVDSANLSFGQQRYFLGETFERSIAENTSTSTRQWGLILPLMSGGVVGWHDRKNEWTNAQTGWFFSQDFAGATEYDAESMDKLFKFHALDYGAWANANLKIAVEDIRASTTSTSKWGSFSVAVYPASTYDNRVASEALEKFTGLTLNPNSSDYIAYRIGNRELVWSDANKLHTENGQYANLSQYIRVEMNPDLATSVNNSALPFGVTGPLRSKGFTYVAYGGFVSSSGPADLNGTDNLIPMTTGSMFLEPQTTTPGLAGSDTKGFVTGGASQPFVVSGSNPFITGSGTDYNTDFSPMSDRSANAMGMGFTTDTTSPVSGGVPAIHAGLHSLSSSVGGPSPSSFIADFTGSWIFPGPAQRASSNDAGDGLGSDAYFGVQATRAQGDTKFDAGYGDMTIGTPFDSTIPQRHENIAALPEYLEYSFVFSLDQISGSSPGPYTHSSGSRAAGTSITSLAGNDYKSILSEGVRQFWAPMYGGFDGLDITEAEPFRNTSWDSDSTKLNSATFNSIQRAIHTIADPEAVECNIITAPGITNTQLTDFVMSTCAARADALGIIDIENVYVPETENTSDYSTRKGSVLSAVSSIQARDLNTSYGCTYYPWVNILDRRLDRQLLVPPSVIALGTFASSEATSELWFAPAGFTRGGLSGGAAGLPVISLTERLTQANRDDLYENNINPIAKFPAEGIVIFGQKTLQQTSSALDRINVRRLMIYVKKEISRIAATILFDQNNKTTWARFTGQVEPFLGDIKARYGLTDFKVVLDETTTTDDLIDRNIMYAKIFLKPARAIEYIAIDFIITRTGASFED